MPKQPSKEFANRPYYCPSAVLGGFAVGRIGSARAGSAELLPVQPTGPVAKEWSRTDLPMISSTFYISFRYSCTNWTAIDPSPTAEATRLTEPDRTSPAANTPGRLVSSRNGSRPLAQCGDRARAGPVRTKPFSSLSISAGSQSVRGTAPMKLNSAGVWMRPRLPRLLVDDLDRAEVAVAVHPPRLRC